MVTFQIEPNIALEEFIFILNDSGLAYRRPMDDPSHLARMIAGSSLIVTAREEGRLIGLLRALSDHCYRCFIADLAVSRDHQRIGIGRSMLQFTRDLEPKARLFLFAAEDAELFYQKLGFTAHDRCYQLKPGDELN